MKSLNDSAKGFFGLALAFFCFFAIASCAFGQDANSQEELRRTSGTIQEIDWVGGKIVINTYGGNGGQATFLLPDNVVLTCGTDSMQPSDFELGDQVEIEFVVTPDGAKVKRLNDTNTLNCGM